MISTIAEKRNVAKARQQTLTSLTTIEIRMMIVLTSIRANKIVSKTIELFILYMY